MERRSGFFLACWLLAATLFVGGSTSPTINAAPFNPASVCPYNAAPRYDSSPANSVVGFEAEVVRLVNLERARYGLWPLQANSVLGAAARTHSQDMLERHYFAHDTPEGVTPAQRAQQAGYQAYGSGSDAFVFVAENLAAGQPTPAAAVAEFMTSAPHCRGFLDPTLREIGTGYAYDANDSKLYDHYWTVKMGSAPKVLPVFVNGGASSTSNRDVVLTLTDETVSSWGSIGPVREVQVGEAPLPAGSAWQPFPASSPPTTTLRLSEGGGTKTIVVRYRDEQGQTVEASATITLEAQEPVAAGGLIFLLARDQPLREARVQLGNRAGGWAASDTAEWLSLLPATGTGAVETVIRIDAAELALGTYSATIIVSDSGASTQQAATTIPIKLVIGDDVDTTLIPLIAR